MPSATLRGPAPGARPGRCRARARSSSRRRAACGPADRPRCSRGPRSGANRRRRASRRSTRRAAARVAIRHEPRIRSIHPLAEVLDGHRRDLAQLVIAEVRQQVRAPYLEVAAARVGREVGDRVARPPLLLVCNSGRALAISRPTGLLLSRPNVVRSRRRRAPAESSFAHAAASSQRRNDHERDARFPRDAGNTGGAARRSRWRSSRGQRLTLRLNGRCWITPQQPPRGLTAPGRSDRDRVGQRQAARSAARSQLLDRQSAASDRVDSR